MLKRHYDLNKLRVAPIDLGKRIQAIASRTVHNAFHPFAATKFFVTTALEHEADRVLPARCGPSDPKKARCANGCSLIRYRTLGPVGCQTVDRPQLPLGLWPDSVGNAPFTRSSAADVGQ